MVSKIIKVNNKKFPRGYKYKFQLLQFKNNEWKQLIRIDNSLHFGESQQHIHIKDKVKKTDLKLWDIEEYLIKIANRLKEKK